MALFKKARNETGVTLDATLSKGADESRRAETRRAQAAASRLLLESKQGVISAAETQPIDGVPIELYAQISRLAANTGGPPSCAFEIASERGVPQIAWDAAVSGWNQRMQSNPSLAERFNTLWRAAS
jgi:hypothetical protein